MLQPRNGAAQAEYDRLDGAADARTSWPALLARDGVDWGVNALLFALSVVMEGLSPFEQVLQRESLPWLSYPLQPNTVPSWTLLPTAYALPSVVLLGLTAAKRLERRDTARGSVCSVRCATGLTHAVAQAKLILGLFFACSLTLFVTNATKLAVGCARPPRFRVLLSRRVTPPRSHQGGRGPTSRCAAGRRD